MNQREVLDMAKAARRMPSREAEYSNLVLNRRIEANNPFITRSVWEACGDPPVESFEGLPVYGGRAEEHTCELQSRGHLVCRVLLAKKEMRSCLKRHGVLWAIVSTLFVGLGG